MSDFIEIAEAPLIPDLRFRSFSGEADYPAMVNVIVEAAEGDADYLNVDALRSMDMAVAWVDRAKDRIIAEVNGQMVGVGRVEAGRNLQGERIYMHTFSLLPAWRGKGIGTAALLHNERRLREIAATHPHDGPRFFQVWGMMDKQVAALRLFRRNGYEPVRYSLEMLRPTMADIPDCPLPPGVEIRPVTDAQLRPIWDAMVEAFRDHWNSIPRPDHAFDAFCNDPWWRKDLSAIGWHGDQCVGTVLGLVSEEECEKLGRRRMWTETICVRRPWRRRGVARALIADSLRCGRDAGYVEAALGVDADNLSGALNLYTSMGYRPTKKATILRKLVVE